VDANLLQAEKLAQSTIEVQQKMPQAVELMNQLAEYEGKLEMEGIDIPLKECFYPKLDIITKVFASNKFFFKFNFLRNIPYWPF
jgi:hypothetical protein